MTWRRLRRRVGGSEVHRARRALPHGPARRNGYRARRRRMTRAGPRPSRRHRRPRGRARHALTTKVATPPSMRSRTVDDAQQCRQDDAESCGGEFFEEDAEVPFGDRVRPVESLADSEDSRYRKIRTDGCRRSRVFFEVVPPLTESGDEVASVECGPPAAHGGTRRPEPTSGPFARLGAYPRTPAPNLAPRVSQYAGYAGGVIRGGIGRRVGGLRGGDTSTGGGGCQGLESRTGCGCPGTAETGCCATWGRVTVVGLSG